MKKRFVPADVVAPGDFIREELEERRWTQEDLAEVTGLTRRQIVNLVNAKSAITATTARALADAFGVAAETWMELQNAFELAKTAKEDRERQAKRRLYEAFPIRDMRKRGWITDSKSSHEIEASVCSLLRIKSISESPPFCAAAKMATDYSAFFSPVQIAWLAKAKQLAEHTFAQDFAKDFEDVIDSLRPLMSNHEDVRRVPKALAEVGVRLVLVQHLPGSKIDGAAFWLDDKTPAVAMSLRYDRVDNFWHNLIHELVHIKYRDGTIVEECLDGPESINAIEDRANREAREYLISKEKMDSFVARNAPFFYRQKVIQFAQARGIHPGIVVGQLQKSGKLKYSQLRDLLEEVGEFIIGQAISDGWGTSLSLE